MISFYNNNCEMDGLYLFRDQPSLGEDAGGICRRRGDSPQGGGRVSKDAGNHGFRLERRLLYRNAIPLQRMAQSPNQPSHHAVDRPHRMVVVW